MGINDFRRGSRVPSAVVYYYDFGEDYIMTVLASQMFNIHALHDIELYRTRIRERWNQAQLDSFQKST